jgi:hypothetical protein
MSINNSRVVVGGLAAGVVANIIGYVGYGMYLGPRFDAEAAAVAPALAGRGMTGSAIMASVGSQFVIGLVLAWLYAAMRPRFGPGMRTATNAALVVWLCAILFHLDWLIVGLMTATTYLLAVAVGLVQLVSAAAVGGMLYREEPGASA